MISVKQARWFCADDISLIPNYKEAIESDESKKKLSTIAKSRGPEYWEKWKKARQEKIRLRKMKEGIVV